MNMGREPGQTEPKMILLKPNRTETEPNLDFKTETEDRTEKPN